MSFNTLTSGATTYNHTKGGVYLDTTVPFKGLDNSITVKGGTSNSQGIVQCSLTRSRQVVSPSDPTKRNRLSVTIQVSAADGFTETDVDTLIADLSDVASPAFILRWLNGES
jgi:hypothetical protein